MLEVSLRVLGEEHPQTQISLGNLAAMRWALGDGAGAREFYERVVEIRGRVFGEEHPDTLDAVKKLAATLRG